MYQALTCWAIAALVAVVILSTSTVMAQSGSRSGYSGFSAPANAYSAPTGARSASAGINSTQSLSSVYRKPARTAGPSPARNFPRVSLGVAAGATSAGATSASRSIYSSPRLIVPGYTTGSSNRFAIPAFPSSPTRLVVPRRST